jgi:hypothetical protein
VVVVLVEVVELDEVVVVDFAGPLGPTTAGTMTSLVRWAPGTNRTGR